MHAPTLASIVPRPAPFSVARRKLHGRDVYVLSPTHANSIPDYRSAFRWAWTAGHKTLLSSQALGRDQNEIREAWLDAPFCH